MEVKNVQLSLFDAFGFIFPGILILFSIVLLLENEQIVHLKDIMIPFQHLSAWIFASGAFVAYILGFIINNFGFKLYREVGSRLWKMPEHIKLGAEQARYSILVREYSPRNLAHLEKWNALKAMSHNLSISFLVLFFVSLYKTIQHFGIAHLEWLALAIFSLWFAYSLLHRAFFYHRYYYEDLRYTVEELHLQSRAIKDSQREQQ